MKIELKKFISRREACLHNFLILFILIFAVQITYGQVLGSLGDQELISCVHRLLYRVKILSMIQQKTNQLNIILEEGLGCLEYDEDKCCLAAGKINWVGALRGPLQIDVDGFFRFNGKLDLKFNSYRIVCKLSKFGKINCETLV